MAVSPSFLTFVLEQLAGLRRVTSRRMFGGVGLYCDDTFFAVLDNDTVFFKVNDDTRPRYVERGMPAFAPIPGQTQMLGYFQVPPAVLEDAAECAAWAWEAVGVGTVASAAPRKPRGKRTTGGASSR